MDRAPRLSGRPRLERGHRHVGGGLGPRTAPLGLREEQRHYFGGAALAVAAIIASTASATATYQAGQAQADAARYQSKVQRNQAIAAQQAADQAATQDRERTKRIMAANRAALGASGIQTEGSPLLALIDEAQQSELEARTIQAGGAREAAGFRDQATLSRFYARVAGQQGTLGAGATFLSGAASAGRAYYGKPTSAPDTGGY